VRPRGRDHSFLETLFELDELDGDTAQVLENVRTVRELRKRVRDLEEFAGQLGELTQSDSGPQHRQEREPELTPAERWLRDPRTETRHWHAEGIPAFEALRDAYVDATAHGKPIDRAAALRLSPSTLALLEVMYAIAARRYEEILDDRAFSKRKPDHCLPRSTAGRASDRLFPLAECWEYEWWKPTRAAT
jgi:hypothetical protein